MAAQPSGWSRPSEGCARAAGEQQHLKPRRGNSLTSTRRGARKSLRSNPGARMLGAQGVLQSGTDRGCDVFRRDPRCAWSAPEGGSVPQEGHSVLPRLRCGEGEVVLLLRAGLSCSSAGSSNKETAGRVGTGEKQSPRSSHSIPSHSRLREGLRHDP